MIKCQQCEKEFEPTRSDAKFCSDICRVTANRANRNKDVTDNPVQNDEVVTDNSVTDKSDSPDPRTLTPDAEGKYTGHCGHTSTLPICICLKCVSEGKTHAGMGLDLEVCQKIARENPI